MWRNWSLAITLCALSSLPFANLSDAGVGDNEGAVLALSRRAGVVENAQYDTLNDDYYCWYDEGWEGPGWYQCGYEWDNGVGWGGPYGWNGWRGGNRYWRRRAPAGAWPRGAPTHRFGGGAGTRVVPPGRMGAPGVSPGRGPAFHNFGGAPAFHNFHGSGGPPAFHNFGGAPPSHNFGGGGHGR